jgi:serine/threonine-protein kinase
VCPDDGSWLRDETIIDARIPRTPPRPTVPRSFDTSDTRPQPFDNTEIRMRRSLDATSTIRTSLPYDDSLVLSNHALAHTLLEPLPASKDLLPGTKAGEYAVEAKIGEGAMGTVYRAVHPTIGKRVAIKVMSPKLFDEPVAVQRFINEARVIASIRHPGIVDVFGFGRLPDQRTYLAMEWLEGESLAVRLASGPLQFQEALEVLRQIGRALEAAHAKNIAHRDLKPENVFLVDQGDERVVKLLDFGLAKETDQDAGVGITRDGQILGTPLYMSPEQCRSKGVDHRTDIYALGCLAYLLLAGHTPFRHDNTAELISAHLTVEPPRPRKINPHLPQVLDQMLFSMLAKDPAARPSLAEIRRVIGSLLSPASASANNPIMAAGRRLATPVATMIPMVAPPLDTATRLASTAPRTEWMRAAFIAALLVALGLGILVLVR